MSLLEHLPVELFLSILRFVPLQYLYSLRRTSRTINNIIAANESYVYHHAALLHQHGVPCEGYVHMEIILRAVFLPG